MIRIEQLGKSHGNNKILQNISLEVPAGSVTAIIGPSGGGKSTMLRCVNGLEVFQHGSIHVGDLTLRRGNVPKETLLSLRRTVGMVFQQFNLFPHMNVLENVMAGPRYVLQLSREAAESRALQLLERVGLKEKCLARADQLSGGQAQRVAIARTLAVDPQAILFDEPTSALDPKMANEVLAVITDLARSGMTMMVVTHAMNFAERVANQVVVMHVGTIAEAGTPEQIFHHPHEDVTRQFVQGTQT